MYLLDGRSETNCHLPRCVKNYRHHFACIFSSANILFLIATVRNASPFKQEYYHSKVPQASLSDQVLLSRKVSDEDLRFSKMEGSAGEAS